MTVTGRLDKSPPGGLARGCLALLVVAVLVVQTLPLLAGLQTPHVRDGRQTSGLPPAGETTEADTAEEERDEDEDEGEDGDLSRPEDGAAHLVVVDLPDVDVGEVRGGGALAAHQGRDLGEPGQLAVAVERVVGEVQGGEVRPGQTGGMEPGQTVTGEVHSEGAVSGGEEAGREPGEAGVVSDLQPLQASECRQGPGQDLGEAGAVGEIQSGQGGREAASLGRAKHGEVHLGQLEGEEGGEGGGQLQPGQVQVVPGDVQRGQLGQAGGLQVALRGEAGQVGGGEVQGGQPGAGGQLAQGDRHQGVDA